MNGRSILPQLKGKPGPPREWIYCWYYRSGKVGTSIVYVRIGANGDGAGAKVSPQPDCACLVMQIPSE
jgi:hypothetical protein